MADATAALRDMLQTLDVKTPAIPMYSNLTGAQYPADAEGIIDAVSKQASNSVRWEQIIRDMYAQGVDTFIEVGAGTTLSGLVKKTLSDVTILHVSDMESLAAIEL